MYSSPISIEVSYNSVDTFTNSNSCSSSKLFTTGFLLTIYLIYSSENINACRYASRIMLSDEISESIFPGTVSLKLSKGNSIFISFIFSLLKSCKIICRFTSDERPSGWKKRWKVRRLFYFSWVRIVFWFSSFKKFDPMDN